MKVAVVGHTGYVAASLIQRIEKEQGIELVVKIGRSAQPDYYLDLGRAEDFDYSVLETIDMVVFTAGITSPDQCAKVPDVCWKINVSGTNFFIREAIKRDCRVLFFSSDAVFGRDQTIIFDEHSEAENPTVYGRMKKAVEEEFKEEKFFKAIRPSYILSKDDRFTSYCLQCMRTGEQAEIYHPFYRNAVFLSDIIEMVLFLITNWEIYEPTFLNAAGNELVSRVRIADELNWIFDGRLKYMIKIPPEGFFADRAVVIRMRSIYADQYHMLSTHGFTEKMKKEMRGITI